jgi:hypothetical protein
MPRTKPPVLDGALIKAAAADTTVLSLLTSAFRESLRDTDSVVAILEQLRRTNPSSYFAACAAIAKLGAEVPAHTTTQYNVISAIPRSKLDELPKSMTN